MVPPLCIEEEYTPIVALIQPLIIYIFPFFCYNINTLCTSLHTMNGEGEQNEKTKEIISFGSCHLHCSKYISGRALLSDQR